MNRFFYFLFLQQYCCDLDTIFATIHRTIVEKCTKNIWMDSSRIYVLYVCQGSLSERSPSKNVSGNDGIRLTFRYSQPIRNNHFTMTVKKILVQQLLQTQSMVPVHQIIIYISITIYQATWNINNYLYIYVCI